MTNKEFWKGIIPALITPVNEDGTLDLDSLEKVIENIIASGCHGLFVAGSSGEPTNLSSRTKRDVISNAIRIVDDRIPICVGTIAPGTQQTIELVKEVQNMGCNFICSTPNFYMLNERQEDIIHHFEKVSAQTGARIMIYNNDATVGQTIQAETFYKIAEIDNVIAYKDTRPDWENHLKALAFLRQRYQPDLRRRIYARPQYSDGRPGKYRRCQQCVSKTFRRSVRRCNITEYTPHTGPEL